MTLEELNVGKRVRCVCENCAGTGIHKGYLKHDDLGVICFDCNGTGNRVLKIEDNMKLVRDNTNGVVYVVKDGIICHSIELFEELKRREGVNYVMYGVHQAFSSTLLIEQVASEINVITYEEFLNGELPLPMKNYVCPGYISQYYGNGSFDNNCFRNSGGFFEDCSKNGSLECWNMFYGDAKTIEEKRAVLRMLKKDMR